MLLVRYLVLARPLVAAAAATHTTSPAHASSTARTVAARTVDAAAPAANDPAMEQLWERCGTARSGVAKLEARVRHVVLSDGLRAQFRGLLRDEDADRYGLRVTTADVLNDLLTDVPQVVDAVLAGRVAGFGPCALRYTCELAVTLAEQWATRVVQQRARVTAASRRELTVDDVVACRTELARRIEGVLPADAPERGTLHHANDGGARTPAEALPMVEAMLPIVAEVFKRAQGDADYRAMLDDAQFTEASVAALLAPVSEAIAARAAHHEARSAEVMTQQEITRLEGRLRDQLMRLRERVQAARAKGEVLPELRLTNVRVRAPAKKPRAKKDAKPGTQKEAPQPPTPPQPQ